MRSLPASEDLKSDQEHVFPLHLYNHIHILSTHWEEKPLGREQRSLRSVSFSRKSSLCKKGLWNVSLSVIPIPKRFSLSIRRGRWHIADSLEFSLTEDGGIYHSCQASLPKYKKSQSHRSHSSQKTPIILPTGLWVARALRTWKSEVRGHGILHCQSDWCRRYQV